MSDWIDVADVAPRIAYTATASQTAFTVPFVFFAEADLKVYQNGTLLTLATHYTTAGVEDEDGGTVTLLTGATVGDTILIARDLAIVQTTHIPPSGPLDIPAVNIQFSKLIAIDQQTNEKITRSLRLPDNEATVDMQLPAGRANKLLGFDTDGNPVSVLGPSFVGGTDIGAALISTRAVASVTIFDASVIYIQTGGLTIVGDGGAATYKRGTGTASFLDGGGVSWVPFTRDTAVTVATRTVAAASTFNDSVIYLQTGGIATPGDGGAANYKRGTGTGAFVDAAGVSWVPIVGGSGGSTLASFGAIADGENAVPTDNLTAVNAAIAAAGWRGSLEIPNGVYHCSAAPSNPRGVYLYGSGYIQIPEAVTNRKRRWDLRRPQYPLVEGEQFLSVFHQVIRLGSITTAKIEFLGDSTTSGGLADVNYIIHTLVKNNLLTYTAGSVFVNRGVSGSTTEDMRTVQIPLSIANAPHLIIMRPGHNDIYSRGPFPGSAFPNTPTTTNQNATVEAVAELVRVSFDAALASLRAFHPANELSLVVMTPNAADLTVDGRDERYYETLSPMYRELARKYQCCFIDTYRIWSDVRGMDATFPLGASLIDRPYGANDGGIHPQEAFNLQIADRIFDIILPETLRRVL